RIRSRVVVGAAGRREPGERAPHVGERLLHPRERIVRVDLVLEVDVAPVADRLQLLEDLGYRDGALAHDALTLLYFQVAQVLRVHVEEARPRVRDRLHLVGARAYGVPDVDAQPHASVHAADVLQGVVRGREVLVLGAVVVDGDRDVILPGEPLDARQDPRVRVDRDERHAGALRVREVLLHVLVAVPLEGDHAAAHDLESGRFDLAPRRRQLLRR